jgi:5-methyltetrahydropteroyltriglutamate--homocysteine methyltransferase
MHVVCANHGALPRTDPPAADALRDALQMQIDAGLDVVTDGQLQWSDPITPLLAPLDGIRLGSPCALPLGVRLAAQPIVQAKLRRHQSMLVDPFRRAAGLATRPLKVVLTGPYTLAHAAEIATTAYRHRADLAADLSGLLAQEITALVSAGARLLQIDEPLLLAAPQDARLVRDLLEPLVDAANAGEARVIVATYGADAGDAYAQLNTLPGDIVAVDCAAGRTIVDAIAATGSGKPLALGLVDAGTPRLDDVAELRRRLDRLLQRYGHDEVWLQPSHGLAAMSAAQAGAKLRLVASLRDAVATAG